MRLPFILVVTAVAFTCNAQAAKPSPAPRLVHLLTIECGSFVLDRAGGCGMGMMPQRTTSSTSCVVPTDEPELMVDPCGCPSKAMHSRPGQPRCDKLLDYLKVSEACKPVCRADNSNWAAAGCPIPNDQPIRNCETACCRKQRCGDYWADGWPCKGRPPMATAETVCGPDKVCKLRCCGPGDRVDQNTMVTEQLDRIAMDRLRMLIKELERLPGKRRVLLALSDPKAGGYGVAYRIVSGPESELAKVCRKHQVRMTEDRLEVLSTGSEASSSK